MKFIKEISDKIPVLKNVYAKVFFILTGLLSTLWFLIRVIPKPSRAAYPCMRVAAPLMSSFVIYLLGISGIVASYKLTQKLFKQSSYLAAILVLVGGIALFGILNISKSTKSANASTVALKAELPEGNNNPMGDALGIVPGRVVWVWDKNATNENCTFEATIADGYFKPENTSQAVVDDMFDNAMLALTNETTLRNAWDAVFTNFNSMKGRGDHGYETGETIFIKINQGSANWASDEQLNIKEIDWAYSTVETIPQTLLALLRQLIDEYGVPQQNIIVGDPISHIFQHVYEVCHAKYPNVIYFDRSDKSSIGRTQTTGLTASPVIYYSDEGEEMSAAVYDKMYKEMVNADYLINSSALKAHKHAGMTLMGKNHFGSHGSGSAAHLHDGLLSPTGDGVAGRAGYGKYRVLTDLLGHKDLGGKTVLNIIDGLWAAPNEVSVDPVKWQMEPFMNDYPNSIFISQDPVALESVCFDFLRTEAQFNPEDFQNRPLWVGVDDHLHQAASSDNWPAGIVYDPEGDGIPIGSLGVHEHWSDSLYAKYNKNHNPENDGIELKKVLGKSNTVVMANNNAIPVMDAMGDEDCWQDNEWIDINNTWIGWGESMDSTDFFGRYKVTWSEETNLLYFLVEITDDVFIDGYPADGNTSFGYDIIEVFIDEDKSGGRHVFDNSGDDLGYNAENAFSYHIVPGNGVSDENVVTNISYVHDIDGNNWSNQTSENYVGHFPGFALRKVNSTSYVWEFSMQVHNDTYDDAAPENSLVDLTSGKLMGISLAYCDNDQHDNVRDNFIGSVWVPEANFNDHWKDADWYGVHRLYNPNAAINVAPVVANKIPNYVPSVFNSYVAHIDLTTVFTDANFDNLTYSFVNDQFKLLVKEQDNMLMIKVYDGFSGQEQVVVTASDGEYSVSDTFIVSKTPVNIAGNQFSDKKLVIYPNPASGSFVNLVLNEQVAGEISLRIINQSGQVLRTRNVHSKSSDDAIVVDVNGLPNGTFFFMLDYNNKQVIEKVTIK